MEGGLGGKEVIESDRNNFGDKCQYFSTRMYVVTPQ